MKQIISIVPTKELPLAIASITVWNVILLIGGYSTGDWIGVVILGYVAVWVSRLLIVKPVELVSRLNLRRLKTTADLMGIELSEESLANHKVHRCGLLSWSAFSSLPCWCRFLDWRW